MKKRTLTGLMLALIAAGCAPVAEVRGPTPGQNWTSPATGMEFVWIAALNLWVGKYEVTNGEYRRKEPAHYSEYYKDNCLDGDRQPVVWVNFYWAKAYAAWLTGEDRARLDGARYRLPTEAEFMTYAQCGDDREYPWGNNWPPRSGQAGNYADETAKRAFLDWDLDWAEWAIISGYNDGHAVTAPVEESWGNPWGLYGVGGNVWEACASNTAADQSWGAWRGGSWDGDRQGPLRCSCRLSLGASDRNDDGFGFRLVLSR